LRILWRRDSLKVLRLVHAKRNREGTRKRMREPRMAKKLFWGEKGACGENSTRSGRKGEGQILSGEPDLSRIGPRRSGRALLICAHRSSIRAPIFIAPGYAASPSLRAMPRTNPGSKRALGRLFLGGAGGRFHRPRIIRSIGAIVTVGDAPDNSSLMPETTSKKRFRCGK